MSDWYEHAIEPEIRPLVRLLRDNGINTTCSCGHEMYCEVEYHEALGEIETLLVEAGYRHFKIEANRGLDGGGNRYKGITVWLPKSDGCLSKFAFHYGSGIGKPDPSTGIQESQPTV